VAEMLMERPQTERSSGPFAHRRAQRRYRLVLGSLIVLALGFGFAHIAWDNPMPVGSEGFWLIAELRVTAVVVMVIVAFCQALATVSFQTVTANRIVTPSIMGFEALYVAVQTSAIYFLGAAGLASLRGPAQFLLQVAIMVGLALVLYGWLLSGQYGNLHIMLLIGIVVGGGLGALASFMQRLLTPSEFDLLTARLFGSVSAADPQLIPWAIALCLAAGVALWAQARRLNVVALGPDASTSLGINHRRRVMWILFLVSVLMATSTALVGPMTFFGFLVATLAYQFANTYDHRFVFPVAFLLGFVIMCGAYFLMKNVFYAEGVVSIIIEMVGGSVFLLVVLRKGRL
jgi:iron complex transport system permease protein